MEPVRKLSRSIAGKVALVTGAASGMGRATAHVFAGEGAKVAVIDLKQERVDAVVAEIKAEGGEAHGWALDVADAEGIIRVVREVEARFGGLDILVNNAAGNFVCPTAELSPRGWKTVIDIDLNGTFHGCHAAYPYLKQSPHGGTIISIVTMLGVTGWPGAAHCAAAKAGIAALTIQQGAEWGRYNTRVNAIAPDARTRMTEGVFDDMAAPGEGSFDVKDPANASPLVVWLGSDACDVTGRMFEIVGGKVNVCDGWQHGHPVDIGRKFNAVEVGAAVHESIDKTQAPAPVFGA